jgi:hypothetical protein
MSAYQTWLVRSIVRGYAVVAPRGLQALEWFGVLSKTSHDSTA